MATKKGTIMGGKDKRMLTLLESLSDKFNASAKTSISSRRNVACRDSRSREGDSEPDGESEEQAGSKTWDD